MHRPAARNTRRRRASWSASGKRARHVGAVCLLKLGANAQAIEVFRVAKRPVASPAGRLGEDPGFLEERDGFRGGWLGRPEEFHRAGDGHDRMARQLLEEARGNDGRLPGSEDPMTKEREQLKGVQNRGCCYPGVTPNAFRLSFCFGPRCKLLDLLVGPAGLEPATRDYEAPKSAFFGSITECYKTPQPNTDAGFKRSPPSTACYPLLSKCALFFTEHGHKNGHSVFYPIFIDIFLVARTERTAVLGSEVEQSQSRTGG